MKVVIPNDVDFPAALPLSRRGVDLAWVAESRRSTGANGKAEWLAARPVLLPQLLRAEVACEEDALSRSHALFEAIGEGEWPADLFDQDEYQELYGEEFEILAAYQDVSNEQEIETIDFAPVGDDDTLIWLRCAWLSLDEADRSMRFRFSHGIADIDDVSEDLALQGVSARLNELIFPEARAITESRALRELLQDYTGSNNIEYLERTVYFNAPGGGALFHNDVERRHAGVVFAQMTGRTAWLTLSTDDLIKAITDFVQGPQGAAEIIQELGPGTLTRLRKLAANQAGVLTALTDRDDTLEALLNHSPGFCCALIAAGHGFIVNPGDVLLLPQFDFAHCAWHSVFCLGDEAGEALSFAIRAG